MKIESLTDQGIKRKENQDNFWSAIFEVDGVETGVLCICDGMGGLNNGKLASKIVVEAVRDHLLDNFDLDSLTQVISNANSKILGIGGTDKQTRMGTTCSVVVCTGGRYYIYHVGDTRVYRINKGVFKKLTSDHSAIEKYGVKKHENFELWNKYKSMLTRCIGVKETVRVDTFEGTYDKGDIFFACSDGVWHYFDDNPMDLELVINLRGLFDACIRCGETDNLTASLLFL